MQLLLVLATVLFPFMDRQWGYMDRSGKVIIPPRFDKAGHFSGGLAHVSRSGAWGYIDETGRTAIPFRFRSARQFSEGFAAVLTNSGLWGFINREGQWLTPPQYPSALDFHEGRAAVQQNGRFGYIDRSGLVVIAPRYSEAGDFSSGRAVVKINDKYGYIDASGRLVIPAAYSLATTFSEGLAAVATDPSGPWVYVDPQGRTAFPGEYFRAEPFREDVAAIGQYTEACPVAGNDIYGRLLGALITMRQTVGLDPPSPKLCGKYQAGYIGRDGRPLFNEWFDEASSFSDGVAQVCWNKRGCRYIDETGRRLPPMMPFLTFNNGLASFAGWKFFDKKGNQIEPQWQRTGPPVHPVVWRRNGRGPTSAYTVAPAPPPPKRR